MSERAHSRTGRPSVLSSPRGGELSGDSQEGEGEREGERECFLSSSWLWRRRTGRTSALRTATPVRRHSSFIYIWGEGVTEEREEEKRE